MSDELLDIKGAAALLKVSETSLRRWTNAGRLPCLRVGRRRERRFRRADLLAFAEQQPGGGPLSGGSSGGSSLSPDRLAGHLVAAHGDDGGRAELAAAFLAQGFREGRAGYLVASPPIQREVAQRLRERHPVAKSRLDAGELGLSQFVGTVEGQLAYLETAFERAQRRGVDGFCVVGHALDVKRAVGMDGLIDYEAGYDARIARRCPVVTLCVYDVRGFSAADLLGALKLHPDTFRYPMDRLLA
ncbi:MAG: MEDS domain-containing protein [Gemmatimonadales bacterium]